MASADERRTQGSSGESAFRTDAAPAEGKVGSMVAPTGQADGRAHDIAPSSSHTASGIRPVPAGAEPQPHPVRKWLLRLVVIAALGAGAYYLAPVVQTMLNTVSTDDAYVNGHVTFVAPRVSGQVMKVLVDDNYRVKQGALLVQLDKEPYQVQVAIRQAAIDVAKTDLAAALAQVRGLAAQVRANKSRLDRAIEDVNTQLANLKANVATLDSKNANLELAKLNLNRGIQLIGSGGISKEELDTRRETVQVNAAAVEQATQAVHATRVGLGLPAEPDPELGLSYAPPNLNQNFSAVRTALGQLIQSVAQLGYAPPVWEVTPEQAKQLFLKLDPTGAGDVNQIYNKLILEAPTVEQAKAKLAQAREDLAYAELNLRYCDIVSEIDGVVTRRNVNPGNNVQVGQSLMAVRSLTEIWIDANFKETQLADLRIGQRVRCEVDMYGSRRDFEGRITGFTMGTGQTLALLPPQNATGNFVKIVQRLPVRIELTDYDPDKLPLFVGLSVVPYVYYKEPATGPNAGQRLQPLRTLPQPFATPNTLRGSAPPAATSTP
jgi:membrane fusion protein (multidrug efflux system)